MVTVDVFMRQRIISASSEKILDPLSHPDCKADPMVELELKVHTVLNRSKGKRPLNKLHIYTVYWLSLIHI